MTILKEALRKALNIFVRGKNDGLSRTGALLEKLARYVVFITRAAHQEAYFNRPFQGKKQAPPSPVPSGAVAYDIGANNGDDTEYYLRKGLRVVAIEANPTLARQLEHRFAHAIKAERLIVLNIAITDTGCQLIDFFINDSNDLLSSVVAPAIESKSFRKISIPARRLSDLIADHGEPFYVKIDIEGSDQDVLRDLFAAGHRPPFVSAEAHTIEVFCHMVAAGYERFKVVVGAHSHKQCYRNGIIDNTGRQIAYHFPMGSCGPFGDDVPGSYVSAQTMFDYLREHGTGWIDIHAAR